MNYSTLKKTIALSLASVLAIGAAQAQSTTSSDGTITPKVFGGAGQYNTWNLGVNVGLPSALMATGGSPGGFGHWTPTLGWGLTLRDQLQHSFGVELSYYGGKVAGATNGAPVVDVRNGHAFISYSTSYTQVALSGVANVVSVD